MCIGPPTAVRKVHALNRKGNLLPGNIGKIPVLAWSVLFAQMSDESAVISRITKNRNARFVMEVTFAKDEIVNERLPDTSLRLLYHVDWATEESYNRVC